MYQKKIETLEEWIIKLKDFSIMQTKFFYAFFYYGSRLKKDIADTISGFKDGKFDVSGFGLGDILHVLFVDVKSSMMNESSVIKHVLKDNHWFLSTFTHANSSFYQLYFLIRNSLLATI